MQTIKGTQCLWVHWLQHCFGRMFSFYVQIPLREEKEWLHTSSHYSQHEFVVLLGTIMELQEARCQVTGERSSLYLGENHYKYVLYEISRRVLYS